MKVCRLCGEERPLTEFYKDERRKDGHHSDCKACSVKRARAWQVANPKRCAKTKRQGHVRATYGLSPAAYDAMLSDQGFVCAACSSPEPGGRGDWHVDHNHETGAVRALLCHSCNITLGLMGESVPRLHSLITYLERYSVCV